jgi:hypothetical protein
MLRRPPINLNKQSQEATMLLIRGVLRQGIKLTEVESQSRYMVVGFLTTRVH